MMKEQAERIRELEQNIEEMRGAGERDQKKDRHRVRSGMINISTEISMMMRGGVPRAMIDLVRGNVCISGNLRVNTCITFNTPILILLG